MGGPEFVIWLRPDALRITSNSSAGSLSQVLPTQPDRLVTRVEDVDGAALAGTRGERGRYRARTSGARPAASAR